MARTPTNQSLHDRVIAAIANAQRKHKVYTNPGSEKNTSVTINGKKVYPDVILTNLQTDYIEHLIEVETSDSVTGQESEQWALYAQGSGKFWLCVPSSSLDTARKICTQHGITASFAQWWLEGSSIKFEWL